MNAPLIIFGTGSFASLAHYFFNEAGLPVIAFTADAAYLNKNNTTQFEGLPVVPFETVETTYQPQKYNMFISMGYTGANSIRRDKYLAAKQKGYRFANLIHPTACIASNVTLGENCLIMEQVLLQPYTVLGNNVSLWSGAAVFHHTIVEDHCFLGGRCVIAGCSRLGKGSFMGTGAVVRDCIDIPPGSIVGAGAVLLRSPDGAMVHRARYAESIDFKDWTGSL